MSDAGVHISLMPDDHDENRETPDNIVGKGGHAEGDVLEHIENLTGSAHVDMLEGNEDSNVLKGMGGDDWDNPATRQKEGGLFGGAGDDTLAGGDGMDRLEGGPGLDDLWGGSGNDLILGGAGDDFSSKLDATETDDIDRDGDGTDDAVGVPKTYPDVTKVPAADGGTAADGT